MGNYSCRQRGSLPVVTRRSSPKQLVFQAEHSQINFLEHYGQSGKTPADQKALGRSTADRATPKWGPVRYAVGRYASAYSGATPFGDGPVSSLWVVARLGDRRLSGSEKGPSASGKT
jgi:hypothetical protein